MSEELDLYAILGVERNATQEEITKAFRKQVKRHHPDRGGDRELFEKIQHAHEILNDPEKRAHYDQTGDTSNDRRDTSDKQIIEMLHSLLMQTILELTAKDGAWGGAATPAVTQNNLLEVMKAKLLQGIRGFEEQKAGLNRQLRAVNETSLRLSPKQKNETSIFGELLQVQATTVERLLKSNQANIDMTQQAIAFLDRYTYRVDKLSKPSVTQTRPRIPGGW
jgi:curved DNA-binding protein CbpA